MTSIFTKFAIAAVLGLGTLATIPAVASAQDNRPHMGVVGHGDQYNRRPMGNRMSCSSGQAVEKASRTGLRGAHVVRRDNGRVVVEGRRMHRISRIVFANVRGCPIIR